MRYGTALGKCLRDVVTGGGQNVETVERQVRRRYPETEVTALVFVLLALECRKPAQSLCRTTVCC